MSLVTLIKCKIGIVQEYGIFSHIQSGLILEAIVLSAKMLILKQC